MDHRKIKYSEVPEDHLHYQDTKWNDTNTSYMKLGPTPTYLQEHVPVNQTVQNAAGGADFT